MPPYSRGQVGPAKPASKSARSQAFCQAPFSAGSFGGLPGWLAVRKSRRRARNCSSVSRVPGCSVSVVIAVPSDADEVGQPGPVPDRGAEKQLGGLGAFEVQVRVVLPRVADPPMDLDVLLGR